MLLIFTARLGLLVLLYGFVGIVAWLVWHDLKREPATRSTPGPHLVVVKTGVSQLVEGQTFDLSTVTTVGRDLSNDVVLPDSYVSSLHARIERRDNRWWVEDMGATNTVHLNGRPLGSQASAPLDPGDILRIGRTDLKFRRGRS